MDRKTGQVLRRLERLALEDSASDARFFRRRHKESIRDCLARLCSDVGASGAYIDKEELELARGVAHALFYNAGRIADDRKGFLDLRAEILRVAIDLMKGTPEVVLKRKQNRWPTSAKLAYPFSVQAEVTDEGQQRLALVGPHDAPPWFIVAFAFWIVALEVSVSTWRRYVLRTCDKCGELFYDNDRGPITGHARKYCTSCQPQKQKRKKS